MPDDTEILIDCDVHPGVPGTKALIPYMNDYWQEQFVNREIEAVDLASYPPNAPLSCRPDWREPGQKPGVSLERLKEHALDGFGASIAICNPLYGGSVAMSEQMGHALCAATNDWMIKEWLDQEPRLRSSIVVAAQNPILAAEEIDRLAGDKRFVQVLLLVANELLLGRQYYWPIYEAAQRHGLPIGVHAGSMYRYPTTPCGWASHYYQDYLSAPQMFSAQLQSLMSEGVFAKFPDLTFVMIESGVAWVPSYLWRASKTWRGIRGEVPWIKDTPSSIVRERVRFTIQPFDGPTDPEKVDRLINQLGSDDMLLFSSDYPHWHFDGSDPLPEGFPARLYQKITRDNPLKTYPRLKEGLQ
jgi:predicted TIM-barrel fold metal-dependent hydrolase